MLYEVITDLLNGLEHRFFRVQNIHGLLAEIAQAHTSPEADRPRCRLGLLGNDLEQGGFTGPVDSDHRGLGLPGNHG